MSASHPDKRGVLPVGEVVDGSSLDHGERGLPLIAAQQPPHGRRWPLSARPPAFKRPGIRFSAT